MIMTVLLWHLDYMSLTSLALLCMYLVSLAQLYICHLILSLVTSSRDLNAHCVHYLMLIFDTDSWSCCTESYIIIHLHRLIKLIKPGLLGETVAGKIQGGVLRRATPCGFRCHTWSCYLWALLLLHVTWYLSTVNCFSLLSGSTNASLVWYVVILWDGTQDGCIS